MCVYRANPSRDRSQPPPANFGRFYRRPRAPEFKRMQPSVHCRGTEAELHFCTAELRDDKAGRTGNAETVTVRELRRQKYSGVFVPLTRAASIESVNIGGV